MYTIAIFTIKDDLHALVVEQELSKLGAKCHIVESDQISISNSLNIQADKGDYSLLDRNHCRFEVSSLDLIWWRRTVREQKGIKEEFDAYETDLINNDSEASLTGMLFAGFTGIWLSNPFNTRLASNKIIQSKLALETGLNVPRTLISQNPTHVHSFIKELDYEVVIKPVQGTNLMPLYTHAISKGELPSYENILVCPTIYQEKIPGDTHYRINIFGNKVFAFELRSEELDWRPDLTIPFRLRKLDKDLVEQLKFLLRKLNIEMGIIDMKVNSNNGKFYFLEVNPQGQFLFLQGLTGFNLAEEFAKFIVNKCEKSLPESKIYKNGESVPA